MCHRTDLNNSTYVQISRTYVAPNRKEITVIFRCVSTRYVRCNMPCDPPPINIKLYKAPMSYRNSELHVVLKFDSCILVSGVYWYTL